MRQIYLERGKQVSATEFWFLTLTFIIIFFVTNVHFYILFLTMASVIVIFRYEGVFFVKSLMANPEVEVKPEPELSVVMMQLIDTSACAEQLLLLVREIIDLSFTHEGNKEMFFKKFREAVHIDALREKNILNFEMLFNEETIAGLSPKDREFYILYLVGFTYRELSVVYNHSNPKSIYVKQSRLKQRLEQCS